MADDREPKALPGIPFYDSDKEEDEQPTTGGVGLVQKEQDYGIGGNADLLAGGYVA